MAKWCGVTSQLTRSPRLFAKATIATERAVERCATWKRAPVSSARRRSRATITSSDATGMPRRAEAHRFDAFMHVAARAEVEIFAVIDHRNIEGAREFHGAPHDARVHHRAAIVRDRDDARFVHGADGREFLAETAFGDGADGEHVDAGDFAGTLHDVAGHGVAVVDRRRVGHTANGGEATCRRRPRAALNGFGVLDAGFAQVHVHVDETGRDDGARRRRGRARRRPAGQRRRLRSAHRESKHRPCRRSWRRDRSRGHSKSEESSSG